jgi:hypothetical protein
MKTLFTAASCSTCDTLFERLPVEYDEFGAYVFLEQLALRGLRRAALLVLPSFSLRRVRRNILYRSPCSGAGRN